SKGIFVVFEGIDGSGKSTQLNKAEQFFVALGIHLCITREPGGTQVAEELRNLLLADREEQILPITEALMLYAGRAQHLDRVIKPHLAAGGIVLCDRYVYSSYLYQGIYGQVEMDHLSQLDAMTGVIQPDYVLWFNATPEVAASRLARRKELDRMDVNDISRMREGRDTYRFMAEQDPERFREIDADGSEHDVFCRVLPHLMEIVNRHKARPAA